MNFSLFKAAVNQQFSRMSKHSMFRTAATKDELWSTYLSSFPIGPNPIYRTRTEHDCQCCKQFIRAVGNAVAVIDGKLETLWDGPVSNPAYRAVSNAMASLVLSKPIEEPFLHYEATAGTDKNFQDTLDGVKTWNHFFVRIPEKFVVPGADLATKLNDKRTAHDVLIRGLAELSTDALTTVSDLIAQNSIYRGSEHKHAVTAFSALKVLYDRTPEADRPQFTWVTASTASPSVVRFRNTSIGTLVQALSEGKELDDAVRAFEAMMAPANYKRPTSLVTSAMIEKAKQTVASLGLSSALERRYAVTEDITVQKCCLRTPTHVKTWVLQLTRLLRSQRTNQSTPSLFPVWTKSPSKRSSVTSSPAPRVWKC